MTVNNVEVQICPKKISTHSFLRVGSAWAKFDNNYELKTEIVFKTLEISLLFCQKKPKKEWKRC